MNLDEIDQIADQIRGIKFAYMGKDRHRVEAIERLALRIEALKNYSNYRTYKNNAEFTDEDMMIAYSRGQNDVADASLFHDCTRPLVNAKTFISEYRKQKGLK